MKLLTFRDGAGLKLGVGTDAGAIDVEAAAAALGGDGVPRSIDEAVAGGRTATDALAGLIGRAAAQGGVGEWLRDETSLELGPCVPNPGKIVCVGLNYRKHAEESNLPIPQTPVLFSKFRNTIAAPNEPVPLPPVGVEYDYEVELGVVIGREARNVSEEDALGHVFGYCTANDVSCRDLQTRTSQWLLGKTLDKFLPIGPWLVTADEAGDPQAHTLRTWHNGTLRQDSTTADMIFSVREIVSYVSKHFPLDPGDVIVTGTPSGVIMGLPEKNWLKPGDEVTVEVEGLGKLTNRMAAG
ncbi:MAG TPA: fumarylacetoacetate hydrolase family protein [Thermomicrobiales bacterium]|nr:fumarylacetoacetate hydrolase family protein [Thermomicrobiales bacterium]